MHPDQIGLQLWTVRRELAADVAGTLEAVARVGYRAVELAGLPDLPTPELARLLRDAGLRVVASHEGVDRFRTHTAEGVADRLEAFGCRRAVVPWMPEDERRTADDVRRFAAELSALGAGLAKRGIGLAYHNHDFEFAPLNGTTIWDVLLESLSPGVELEIDVHWAAAGGRDPVAEIRRHPGRVRLLHMKDRIAEPEPRDVPPGQGDLPMADIVEAGREAGVEWYIVEQDEPEDALRDVERGLRYLERLAGGEHRR